MPRAAGPWRVFSGPPFGFAYDANRKLVPVPEQQCELRRIRKLPAQGLSPRKISAELGARGVRFSHMTTYKPVAAGNRGVA